MEVFSLTMIVFNSVALSDNVQMSKSWSVICLVTPLVMLATAVCFAFGKKTILALINKIKSN